MVKRKKATKAPVRTFGSVPMPTGVAMGGPSAPMGGGMAAPFKKGGKTKGKK